MKTAVISPSGRYYGSEQTLYTFLSKSNHQYDVIVKNIDGGIYGRLKPLGHLKIFKFKNVKLLYAALSVFILFRYNVIYVNEGAHIRYIKLLARLYKRKKFVIHIRLTEDTRNERLKNLPRNVTLIPVSEYMKGLVYSTTGLDFPVLSSPLRGGDCIIPFGTLPTVLSTIKVGIVGRVSASKRLDRVLELNDYLSEENIKTIELHLYGDLVREEIAVIAFEKFYNQGLYQSITIHGFVEDKRSIYENVDVVLHLNSEEPLGVVFFEALCQGVPFIGMDKGGSGEIAKNLGLEKYSLSSINFCEDFIKVLEQMDSLKFDEARVKMKELYSIENYVERLESIIIV